MAGSGVVAGGCCWATMVTCTFTWSDALLDLTLGVRAA
jgi:hypothetical protein